MSSLIREPRHAQRPSGRRLPMLAGFLAIVFLAFLVAPGSLASKSHVALHGLCAQRPSHSIEIGGTTLPMDARMTGIYVGSAVAICWLMAAGRLRAARTPPPPVVVTLAMFVVTLAGDGFNALLVDLGAAHPYEPANALRLGTGILAGTTLGVVLGHLFAASVWSHADRQRSVVTSPVELLVPIGAASAVAALATADLPILYAPFAAGLLLAAVGVFGLLGMIVLALVSNRGWSYGSCDDLAPLAFAGFVGGTATIAALSALRFAAERFFGLPYLT